MALLPLPRPPAAPNRLRKCTASLTRGFAGRLVLGVQVESSCFLLPPLHHLELSLMPTVWAGSTRSLVPPLLQRGAQPPGLQGLSAALARGSAWGTIWFLLLTSSQAPAFSHRRAEGEAVAMCRLGVQEDVEDIRVMKLDGGRVGGKGQAEEEEVFTIG